ncbi:MAG: flagellar motor protein [Bdellovibrionaceae bacterium]|nr:flagellar motor protein [Pseudobdellovibrionaceae bacterium]
MELTTLIGLLVGIGGIFVGNLLEGGHTSSLMQFTAGFIVITGTIGATMVSSKQHHFKLGFELLVEIFKDSQKKENEFQENLKEIVECTKIFKRESVVALEPRLNKIKDIFLQKIIRNVIDGIDPQISRDTFYTEIDSEEETLMAGAKIWSDAGGFAPTIGILGAVLGLIHVMGNLSDTSKLGQGIAVAFVATVYGVGLANLICLPFANKLKSYIEDRINNKKILLEGALLISSGLSSAVVQQRLSAYLEGKKIKL